jgi:predicted nucleic acid-binding protein
VYGSITIPLEVEAEISAGSHPALLVVQTASWLQIHSVRDPQDVVDLSAATRLGAGECAAILLAEELNARLVLIDDLSARRQALSRGLPLGGTVGTLLTAKQMGLLHSVKAVLDDLIGHGTRIHPRLYAQALAAAGE